jgi:uncharacterized protein (TIGR01777 family)
MTEPTTENMPIPTQTADDPRQRPKFLISGSSGMIGNALVRSWMPDPIQIVRLVRSRADKSGALGSGETVFWDPGASPAIPDLDSLRGVVAAVHLSGANISAARWTEKYKREIVSSRVQSTLALARALTQLKPLPQVLVCASANGIFGDRGDEVLTEESPPGTGFLAETCRAWEATAQVARDAGIRVVNARIGVVLSPNGGALKKLLPLFRLGLGGNLGDGRAWMPWLTLRDAVGILRYCVDREDISGPVNTVAPNPVTNAEFTRALGSAVHRPAILPMPAFALRLAVGEMADQAMLASARVVPAKLIGAGYRFADPELVPALRGLVS